MEKFFLDNYLRATNEILMESEKCTNQFENVCISILSDFFNEWKEGKEELSSLLNIQKRAIIGYEKEVAFFKDKIKLFLKMRGQTLSYCPDHYLDIEDGIYNECFGLAGISEWFTDKYSESSSAKIIGDRIYFLEKGKMILKPQRIEKDRREQLIRAFLLLTPTERLDKNFHEIYMLDGTRVTIFGGEMTKNDQDVIIFRRYIIPMYTFEEQASRGTIPIEAKDLFVNMVDIGYNVAFLGAVRSAKTSFLATWQSYEDANLEGVMVETDPEIPIHNIMKNAPIIQLIADNDDLKRISKNLLRSDADYFILAEARDGIALDTAIKIASKGTRRMKITFHSRDPLDFCYDVASEIVKAVGGNIENTQVKVAKSFDYIFHFVQLKDKSQKRLKGIYELSICVETKKPKYTQICRYDYLSDNWKWFYEIGADKKEIGLEENLESYNRFSEELKKLSDASNYN